MAVPEHYWKQRLHLISCERYQSYRQIISSRLYVRLKGTVVHLLVENFCKPVNKINNADVYNLKIPKKHRGPRV